MWYSQPMLLVVRSDVDPFSVVESVRAGVREMDPALPLSNVRSLDAVTGAALATRRLTLWLVASFGVTALFLAVVGIYGVIAQGVGQRTQEFGVRQALGATRADILRLVLSRGVLLTIAGLGAGLLLSIAATRLLASLLYQVDPVDMATLASVSTLLLIASLGAACIPAWRAACVSAAAALRGE
jgi:ABC-type antimicrobial peptide transport system permease subunit